MLQSRMLESVKSRMFSPGCDVQPRMLQSRMLESVKSRMFSPGCDVQSRMLESVQDAQSRILKPGSQEMR